MNQYGRNHNKYNHCVKQGGWVFKAAQQSEWDGFERMPYPEVEWPLIFYVREGGGKETMRPFFLLFSCYDMGIFIPGNLVKMHRSSPATHLHLFTNIFQRET